MVKKHLVHILWVALATLLFLSFCCGQSASGAYSQVDVPFRYRGGEAKI